MMQQKSVSGAQLRGAKYHFNTPIPVDIRHLYPKHKSGTYRGSMYTRDPDEAERQVRSLRAEFDRHVNTEKRKADQARLANLLDPDQRGLLNELGGWSAASDALADLRVQNAALLNANPPSLNIDDAVDQLLSNASGIVNTDILKAVVRQTLAQEFGGSDVGEHDNVLVEIQTRAQAAANRAYQQTIASEIRQLKKIGLTLGESIPAAVVPEDAVGMRELCDMFLKSKEYDLKLAEKYTYTTRRWVEFHGDMPMDMITRAHLHEFCEALKDMPAGVGQFRKLPMRKCIAQARAQGRAPMSESSRSNFVSRLKKMLAFAMDKTTALKADPFAGYKVDKKRGKFSAKQANKRKAFSQKLTGFVIDQTRENHHPDTLDYWLPTIAFYTGARREEIGQLLVSNIERVGNLDVIKITDRDPAQKVKNQHSLRGVPVPTKLHELGFMALVERRRQAGGHFLFLESETNNRTKQKILREPKLDTYGRLTEMYGHRFADWLEQHSIKEPSIVFHSTRHSWQGSAERSRMDKEIRRMIAGRLDGEDAIEADYGEEELLQDKLIALDAMAKFVRS